jgi:hypothetical protein
MGNFSCLKSSTINSEIEMDRDIDFKAYRSSSDNLFHKLEVEYNILKYLQLHDYSLLFSTHRDFQKPETADAFSEVIELHSFVHFTVNKIVGHPLLAQHVEQNEREKNIYEDYMKELYEMVRLAMKEFRKERIKVVQKIHLLPHAILYCYSPNSTKIQFLFNLFSVKGLFEKTQLFEEFIFIQIATASCIMFFIQNRISDKYHDLKAGEDVQESIFDTTEMKDLHKLKDIFINNLFEDQVILNRQEYEERMRSDKCIWIFSSKGIRSLLEIHNE